jgi:molybdopterin-guanine dinucleotide biosynthesis protein B
MSNCVPVLQVVGYKRSGKTTLLTRLVNHFTFRHRLNILTIKHHYGHFEYDREGSDSWAHRQAGAKATVIQSSFGLGLILAQQRERSLADVIKLICSLDHFDLVLIEGYKDEHYPKLVMIRDKGDISLLESLTQIKGVVFKRESDYQWYITHNCYHYPAFLMDDQNQLFLWAEELLRSC